MRSDDETADGEVAALEGVAAMLDEPTEAERDELARVVEAELEAVTSANGNASHIAFLSTFMESFVEGWVGNRRIISGG